MRYSKSKTIEIERIHRGLIESWKLWLSWFMWFFGINIICIGWILNVSVYTHIHVISVIFIIYHISGIIISFGLSYYTYLIGKYVKKYKIDFFGFPINLAVTAAFVSGINLVVQLCVWIWILIYL